MGAASVGGMFALPGITALIVFVLVRPQEFVPALQRVPFLHVFAALAVLGWLIDLRLRRLQPMATPALPWAMGFLAWGAVTVAAMVPDKLVAKATELAVLFALYGTIAHGVQRFRAFQVVAGVMAAACLFIAVVCIHQGLAPTGCVGGEALVEGEIFGEPDGRACAKHEDCYGPDAEPGFEYRCEHVGLFGTYSVDHRVRYRGELQDPNEVSLAMSVGALGLLVAFARRKRSAAGVLAAVVGVGLVLMTVWLSRSRGGLVSVMLVFGVYVVRRFGAWTLIPAGAAALAVVLFGGRTGADADVSTMLRYEAWATGLELFKKSPVFGVGAGQFVEHHFLTAHNSFVLALAELGFVGMVLFTCVIYVTVKSLVVGLRELRGVPGSEVAQVWGMALLAAMAALAFQINTLSFAYHSLVWMVLGLVGAWTGAVRFHHPSFVVRMTWKDVLVVTMACLAYAGVVLPVLLRLHGAR